MSVQREQRRGEDKPFEPRGQGQPDQQPSVNQKDDDPFVQNHGEDTEIEETRIQDDGEAEAEDDLDGEDEETRGIDESIV